MPLWMVVVSFALLFGAMGTGIAMAIRDERAKTKTIQLDQTDKYVLAAVKEVDAFLPAYPILDPKIAEREAKEATIAVLKQQRLVEAAYNAKAEEARFFMRQHNVPFRSDLARSIDGMTGIVLLRNGRRISVLDIEQYGWEGAVQRSELHDPRSSN